MASRPVPAPGTLSWPEKPPEEPSNPRDYDLWASLITAIGDTSAIEFTVRKRAGRPTHVDVIIESTLDLDGWAEVARKARDIQAARLGKGAE